MNEPNLITGLSSLALFTAVLLVFIWLLVLLWRRLRSRVEFAKNRAVALVLALLFALISGTIGSFLALVLLASRMPVSGGVAVGPVLGAFVIGLLIALLTFGLTLWGLLGRRKA